MLVMRSPCVGSPALGRLAVAEVEEGRLVGSAMSSESEHCGTLRLSGVGRSAWGYLSLRDIGDPGVVPDPSAQ